MTLFPRRYFLQDDSHTQPTLPELNTASYRILCAYCINMTYLPISRPGYMMEHFQRSNVWKEQSVIPWQPFIHNSELIMMADPDLRQYCHIFEESKPCSLWKSPMNCWGISVIKFICKIYAVSNSLNEHQLYPLCDSLVSNIFLHVSCSCPCTFNLREVWWCDIARLTGRWTIFYPAWPPYFYTYAAQYIPHEKLPASA